MNEIVAVVTGASRGIGKAIALEIGRAGATVYVTGRTTNAGGRWPSTIHETAAAITAAGGRGLAVPCDHGNDDHVASLFKRVASEYGRIDLLVNNAAAFGDTPDGYPEEVPFWELSVAAWDEMLAVGLRSHYVASRFAAPLFIQQRHGLIVNVSSAGAHAYAFNAGYGVTKAGVDKLTSDMAHDLSAYGVAVVSLWPPFTRTEKYVAQRTAIDLSAARSPEFTGRAVLALLGDPAVGEQSGRSLRVTDLASHYGFAD